MTQVVRGGIRDRLDDLLAHVRTPVYRNAYALVVNAGLSSVLGMVYWVLVARLYTTDEVGRASAVISALVFLAGISQLNLRPVMSRFIPVAGPATGRFILASYLGAAAVSVLVALVFLLGVRLWADEDVFTAMQADPRLALVFVGLTVAWCLFALQDGVLVGLRQSVLVPLENTLFGVGKIGIAVALVAVPVAGAVGIIASWAVPMVIALVVVNVLVVRRLLPAHVRESTTVEELHPRRIGRFVAGDYLGSLFGLAYVSLLPIVVLTQTGATASAHFYIVWVIASSVQLVSLQMITSLVVESAGDADAFRRGARHMTVQMLRLLVPATLALIVGADLVLGIFGPSYAEDGATVLRLLALSLVPSAIVNLYQGYARVRQRILGLVATQAFLAVVTLGLAVTLLPTMGLTGVGVAFLVAQGVLAAWLLATSLRPVLFGSRGLA